jgi:hypothetical protein
LSGIGSADFNDLTTNVEAEYSVAEMPVKSKPVNIPVNNTLSSTRNKEAQLYVETAQAPLRKQAPVRTAIAQESSIVAGSVYGQNLDLKKEKTLEKMYSPREYNAKEPSASAPMAEGNTKKIFIGFVGLCLVAFAGVAAYLYLPSAKIIIEPNVSKNKINLGLLGAVDIVEADQRSIPIRVINKEESISLPYEVKGEAALSGKKAHGSIVIYNEYDKSPQTLIATTRFESADGKVFRIVRNVIVPGTTIVAGEAKPGVITAEVIADQSGPDYNIDPSSFTIPGFKDGPKYAKFYAKSTEQMVGGSTDGETLGGAVVQKNIDDAKRETEIALKDKISQSIKDGLSPGDVVLEQAEKITVTKSAAAAKVGDMLSTFNYTATASIQVLVFSENDVRKIMEQRLTDNQQLKDVKKDISKVEYGTVNSDFDKNTLELKIYGEVKITPIFDGEEIKKELLGKTEEQLADILKKYPDMKSVHIEFHPTFVSRISQYAGRVSVEIATEN